MSGGGNGVLGCAAGMTAAAVLMPLENIKVAIMVPPSNLKMGKNFATNFLQATRFLAKEGGISAFYKGIFPNVIKTGLSSAIYYQSLRAIENFTKADKSLMSSFVSSAIGRIMSAALTNPLSVI